MGLEAQPTTGIGRGPRWGGLLALLGLGIALGLTIAGGAAAAPTGPEERTVTSTAAADEGRELYLRSCASCHGEAGRGSTAGPPITDVGTASWDFQLRTGRMPLSAPGETAYRQEPAFSAQQIEALVAYAATITRGPEVPRVVVANGNLEEGWSAYVQNCAGCHAATGAGDAVGGGFIAPSLLESDPQTVAEAILVGPGAMPPFPFLANQLDSIAAYVEYLKSPNSSPGGISMGGLGPVAEGFVAVFFGLGSLYLVARWIERRSPGSDSRRA
jgi:ubiquinol-cytochrome c reductase cytochrome c subunit